MDLVAITTAFADLEANLEWAIARQAMRLRGLSDDIRRNVPPRAKTQGAWLRRLTRRVARLRNMDKAARKLAWRMAKAGAVEKFCPLRLAAAQRSTSHACGEGGKPHGLSLEFPPPACWGRWLDASSRPDGGGITRSRVIADIAGSRTLDSNSTQLAPTQRGPPADWRARAPPTVPQNSGTTRLAARARGRGRLSRPPCGSARPFDAMHAADQKAA